MCAKPYTIQSNGASSVLEVISEPLLADAPEIVDSILAERRLHVIARGE
jgi:hypothetical protein